MVLSVILHFTNLDSIGDANAYYTAAVKSMLISWKNFFYVAAEPGGSVTVDKPPLGLWIEGISAYFLGVSGFSVSLPNILAGVFGIPLLYAMVKKYLGPLAALVAALVMAFTPVFVATNRNNTMDGLLVFFLLLAAWAFIRATETGSLGWVLAGAFLLGLGFNIKMLQAFLPLPAFYALYFFGSKVGWIRKLVNLGVATVLLLVVSLSWAVAVDLVAADQRPFIGSSGNNTVMGLITGHNGTSRLFGGFFGRDAANQPDGLPVQDGPNGLPIQGKASDGAPQGNPGTPPQPALDACAHQSAGASCSFELPNRTITGTCLTVPGQSRPVCAPQASPTNPSEQLPPQRIQDHSPGSQGGTPFSQETGTPGLLRFFVRPLSRQMSWLLPFALVSLVLAFFGSRLRLPLESGMHKSLLCWGGWLIISLVFFSAISGIFHAYYTIMLVPALAAVVGMGFAQLWTWGQTRNWARVLLVLAAVMTLLFQAFALSQYGESIVWTGIAGAGLLAGTVLLIFSSRRQLAFGLILSAMLVAPVYWTLMTVGSNANQNLPAAYQGTQQSWDDPGNRARQEGQPGSNGDSELIAYLQANTQDVAYLVAVPSSQNGASLVLATGRPVLYMGGFSGQDQVADARDLAEMVANKELRFVLYGAGEGGQSDIINWLQTSCTVVSELSRQSRQANFQAGPENQGMTLYRCGE